MSGNLSVTAANLQGWVVFIQSAGQTYQHRLIQAIFERYSPLAPAMTLDGIKQELGWREQALEALRVAHHKAELAYAAEQSDDPGVRQELDSAEGELRAALVGSRQMFTGNFGEPEAVKAGLTDKTPEGGHLMLSYAENFLEHLRAEPVRMSLYGASIDMNGNIRALEAAHARVKAAQAAHVREARELQEAKLNRDEAQAALRSAYVQLATYYESLFRMAGLDALADRLRPTARRASSVEPPPEEPLPVEEPVAT